MINFGGAELEQMVNTEGGIVRAIQPYRGRVPVLLVIFALVRVARRLLMIVPVKDQQDVLPVIVGYLQGNEKPPMEESPIWTPERRN